MSETIPRDVIDIIGRVRRAISSFSESRRLGYSLQIDDDGYLGDGDWLYLIVKPSREGIHASDYAKILGEAEQVLKKQGIDKVLLVPAKPE